MGTTPPRSGRRHRPPRLPAPICLPAAVFTCHASDRAAVFTCHASDLAQCGTARHLSTTPVLPGSATQLAACAAARQHVIGCSSSPLAAPQVVLCPAHRARHNLRARWFAHKSGFAHKRRSWPDRSAARTQAVLPHSCGCKPTLSCCRSTCRRTNTRWQAAARGASSQHLGAHFKVPCSELTAPSISTPMAGWNTHCHSESQVSSRRCGSREERAAELHQLTM